MRTKLINRKSRFSLLLTAAIAVAIVLTLNACGGDDGGGDQTLSSSGGATQNLSSSSARSSSSRHIEMSSFEYDGITYETVKIGNQTWLAGNLKINVDGSRCYGDDPVNCIELGRLYDWATAMKLPKGSPNCNILSCSDQIGEKHQGICPPEWHIPSEDDWKKLIDYVGKEEDCNGSICAGKYLKSDRSWVYEGTPVNGTNSYGFFALPGGYGSDGEFYSAGILGHWWSSTEWSYNDVPYFRLYSYEQKAGMSSGDPSGKSNKLRLHSVRCVKN
ncbi:MAG: hypothetical protein LBH25_10130 [Fibromonadaceae bacterium]|jgi:uncharacterized protein (TIGR02145 family)|nr:hypothetical protein [Fibromonadaceae bacterium]